MCRMLQKADLLMPTYEYACYKCDETFEVRQSIHDRPLEKHPGECGGDARRIISKTSFRLKGGGWADKGYGK